VILTRATQIDLVHFRLSVFFNFDGDLSHLIGPAPASNTASDFYFTALVDLSDWHIVVINFNVLDQSGFPVTADVFGSTVPLPAALPMVGSVLGGGWLLARWRRRKRRPNQAEAPSPV